MRAAEKIIEGLTQLMEGFVELQAKIEGDFDSDSESGEEEDSDLRVEIDAALVTEMRATLEALMDAEDYSADEIATFISVAQDALEEIDPDVFEEVEEEDAASDSVEDEDDYYVDDDGDDDYDFDYEEDDEDDEDYEDDEE